MQVSKLTVMSGSHPLDLIGQIRSDQIRVRYLDPSSAFVATVMGILHCLRNFGSLSAADLVTILDPTEWEEEVRS